MEPTLPPLPSVSSRPPSGKIISPPVDLNALLSYKLSIDFAPLSSSLLAPLLSSKADSSEIDSLRAELAVIAAASESLKELLSQPRGDSDSLPSVPLTKFLEMENAANARFEALSMEVGASRRALEERVEIIEARVEAAREGGNESLKTERDLSGIATEAATTSAKDATDAAVEARSAAAEAARSAVDADRAAAMARTAAGDLGAVTAAAHANAASAALAGAAAASKAADEAAARLAAALQAVGLPAPPPVVPEPPPVDLGPLEEKLQQLARSARETQERAEAIDDKVAILAAKEDVNTIEHALLTERSAATMKLFEGIFTVTSAANAGDMASEAVLSTFPNHKSLIDFASLLNKITMAEKAAEVAAARATAAEAAIANLTSELWAVRAAAERGEAPPPRLATPPLPPPSAPGVSIKEMDALRAEVKAGLSSLGARMGGAEGVGLSALKDARDAQKIAERALAAAASGGGGGGGGGSGKYDILEPDIASWAAALTHAVSIAAGGAADAPPSPAIAIGGWRALADRAASALSSARPAASAFELRALSASAHSLDQRLTAAEAAARIATTQSTSDRALLPAPGQLVALEAADGLLEGTKADKNDTDARISSLRSALAGMASRVNDVAKRAAEAKASASAANVAIAAATDGSGFNNNGGNSGGLSTMGSGSGPGLGAAATGRQLLRDLYCISCSRPADNVSTDRGPHYITGAVMPSTVLHAGSGHAAAAASHAHHFMMNDAVDTAASALEPFERATRAANLTALSGTGAFQVLPNGQVISKISMRSARGPSSSSGGVGGGGGGVSGGSARPSGELEAYADAASTLGAAGMVSLSANHRSPTGAPASARLYPPPEPRAALSAPDTLRTISDQGLPAAVTHRGGAMPSSMSAGVSVGGGVTSVASPVVDPKLGTPLPHFYAAVADVAISSESNE